MVNPLCQKLSEEEWEAVWPSSDSKIAGRTAVERAREFGIDISLLTESLKRSPTERLLCAQQAAASIFSLREEIVKARR